MMVLKCITIYLFIGWLYEGIAYLYKGGINKFWDEFISEGGYDKDTSQEVLDFAVIFTIIVVPFIWPFCIGYGIYRCIELLKHK